MRIVTSRYASDASVRCSGISPTPSAQVQDLRKGVLQGHEVEGKRYVIQPPVS